MAAYTYLPWIREGLIGAVTAGTVTNGRLALTVQASVSGGAGATADPIDILLFGPGDATGFDARQVIGIEPRPPATDFEPNYFPFVEFDRPDFPWLLTPEAPDANNQLTPWLCLIVVERRDGVDLTADGTRPLPVLTIAGRAHDELPDLSEAWAWAHAQVAAVADDADLDRALGTQPERTLSRLLCPRRLKPSTPYLACVVPTYNGGVHAGLGEPVAGDQALEPAWTLGANQPTDVRLPVYFSWEFSTGVQGDFESLVWQLERRHLPAAQVGARKMEIASAGYGLPASPPVDLEGALGPDIGEDDDERVGPPPDYQQRVQALLNEATAVPPLPVLPPPIYGRWHARQRAIPDPIGPGRTRDRAWVRALNLDPRFRVAAGLGAEVVRQQQEQLMSAAWDQVGDVLRANQMLRQARLAQAASLPIHEQRLATLDLTTFLTISAPVQPRVRYTSAQSAVTRTASGHVAGSALPAAATSAQFRRMVRPRGAVARRFGVASAAARDAVVAALNAGQISGAPNAWPVPRELPTMEGVLDRSPCRSNPLTMARALVEVRPPAPLVSALDAILGVFIARRAEIDAMPGSLRQTLERIAKSAATARDQLRSFEMRIGQPQAKFLELVLALYRPALSLIADLQWLLLRISAGTTPPAIEDLNAAAAQLPSVDDLPDINFALAAMIHQQSAEPCEPIAGPRLPALDLAELKARVLETLNPAASIPARIASLIEAPDWEAAGLDIVMAAPEFPAPMYQALAKLGQDWLLPGLERVPANTLALVEANPRFIEAFMIGLNHEMSRELLWRGYPTDQRGTYFRQFWDPSGRFPPPQDEAERAAQREEGKDMPPLHEWGDGPLGTHFGAPRAGQGGPGAASPLVLLIRGDLLRRYPRAMIYLAQAAWSRDGAGAPVAPRTLTAVEKQPIFRGQLDPDVQLLGFDIRAEVARGTQQPTPGPDGDGAGWFVVLQQQPTEPRYGLDETPASSAPNTWTWRDLSWAHVRSTHEAGYIKLAAGTTDEFPETAQRGPGGESWTWTPSNSSTATQPDSAQIACITLQQPVRVAVHASDLL